MSEKQKRPFEETQSMASVLADALKAVTECPEAYPRRRAAPSPSPVVEVSEEMVEAGAKAIARAKRAPGVSEALIDRVWPSYVGQSRACLIAALRVR